MIAIRKSNKIAYNIVQVLQTEEYNIAGQKSVDRIFETRPISKMEIFKGDKEGADKGNKINDNKIPVQVQTYEEYN